MEVLERRALESGYRWLRLETGHRQQAAMALYESLGYYTIPPFGEHVGSPTACCYEKALAGFR
jgi:ribosomal protein S18 acetylase RimI-like enzyme